MDFVVVAKSGRCLNFFRRIEEKEASLQCHEVRSENKLKKFSFLNNVQFSENISDLKLNFPLEEVISKGKKSYHTWVTNHSLAKANVAIIAKKGRSRWNIEKAVFNTIKNLGHNYSHGDKNLCENFTCLMFLAFFIDQLAELF